MTAPLKTALIYDFDGTLARGNMQEVSFIPSVGMGIGDFWGEAEQLTRPQPALDELVAGELQPPSSRRRRTAG